MASLKEKVFQGYCDSYEQSGNLKIGHLRMKVDKEDRNGKLRKVFKNK